MSSVWISLNCCVEYNTIFYSTFIIYLIIKLCYVMYVCVETFKCVRHMAVLVIHKTPHSIFHICSGVSIVYEMCEFRFPISIFKISEMFLKFYMKRPVGLSNIFSITVLTY